MNPLHIDELPEWVMGHIFSFLTIVEKVRVSRVSRRWNTLSKEASLWRHIDTNSLSLSSYLNPVKLLKLLKQRAGNSLITLRTSHVNKSCLQYIRKNCQNLKELTLDPTEKGGPHGGFRSVLFVSLFPRTLTSLSFWIDSFTSLRMEPEWWKSLSQEHFPQLTSISITGEKHIISSDVDALLMQLKSFTRLQKLELRDLLHSSSNKRSFLSLLAEIGPALTHLRLGKNSIFQVQCSAFFELITANLHLECLGIQEWCFLDVLSLSSLAEMPTLTTLYLDALDLNSKRYIELCNMLPQLKSLHVSRVIYSHERYLVDLMKNKPDMDIYVDCGQTWYHHSCTCKFVIHDSRGRLIANRGRYYVPDPHCDFWGSGKLASWY